MTAVGLTGRSVPPPAGDPASDVHVTQSIEVLRGQIDGLDEAIVRLVAERSRLSARVQLARMNSGGARVELGRERVILDKYRTALGPEGPDLAGAILRLCRGSR